MHSLQKVFGIGTQAVLLVVVLVTGFAWYLPMQLEHLAREVVVSHELVDLSDENARLSYHLLHQIDRLHHTIRDLALAPDRRDALKQQSGTDGRPSEQFAEFQGSNLPRVKIFPVRKSGDQWHLTSQRSSDGLESETPEPYRSSLRAFLEQILEASPPPGRVMISRLHRIDRESGVPRFDYVVWAGAIAVWENGGSSGEGVQSELVLAALSLEEAFGSLAFSPRHLGFLIDSDENVLLHPFEPPQNRFDPETGESHLKLDDQRHDPFRWTEKLASDWKSLAKPGDVRPGILRYALMEIDQPEVAHSADKSEASTGTRTRSYVELLPLLENVEFAEDRPSLVFRQSKPIDLMPHERRISADVMEKLQDELADPESKGRKDIGPGFARLQGLNQNVKNIRLLADSADRLDNLGDLVQDRLKRRFDEEGKDQAQKKAETLQWLEDVVCNTCYIQFVRIELPSSFDPADGASAPVNKYWLLGRAVFHEELDADLAQELGPLKQAAWWGVALAAALAFAASLVITRPLKRMTVAAETVSDTRFDPTTDDDRWARSVTQTARRLPVRRHDEVGVLARAFQQMLDNILAAHEQTRHLNRELQDLNNDLERRIHDRTAELEKANQGLEQANQDLEIARKNAEALSRSKDEFLANVSHELRNPLNTLFGYLQFLETSDLDETQQEDVTYVRESATELLELINDILDYQKIIMKGLTLEPSTVDLGELLEEIEHAMMPFAQECGSRLEFVVPEDLGTLYVDARRLRQVLKNLISNACKFKAPDRENRVKVRAARCTTNGQGYVRLEVQDTGRGMTEAEQDALFTKFKKLAYRQGNQAGTGLGLVLCKGLCDLLGANLSYESEYGKGTTFVVDLPLHQAAGEEEGRGRGGGTGAQSGSRVVAEPSHRKEAAAPADQTSATFSPDAPGASEPAADRRPDSDTVLVIDDDASVRAMMQRFLERQGYKVVTAQDGISGLEVARRVRPSLITLDALMPVLDGWAVLAALKTDEDIASIPVVMVTVVDNERKGYALGADEFVMKPIDWEHLSNVLHRWTGDRQRELLVVEDEARTREVLRRQLQKDGWQVAEAENGAEALKRVEQSRPAAILLDLIMPVMDGFEFLEKLRQYEEASKTPVIVITAKDPTPQEVDFLNKKVTRVLQKGSYTQDELLGQLHRLVRRHTETVG